MKNKYVTYAGSGVFALLAIIVAVSKPFAELSATGHLVICGLLIAIGIWIFQPFKLPFSGGALFLASFLLICKIPASVVFSGFTQSALWTLIAALFFGFVLAKSGLGKRIAFAIIKLFKPSYPSMILAWVIIGVVLSLLTPAITVRVAIVIPIAAQMCELFNLKKGSKGNSLIMLTAFSMALMPGTAWQTGSLWGSIVAGLFNSVDSMKGLLTAQTWSATMMLPMGIVCVLLVVLSYIFLKPSDKLDPKAIEELKAAKTEPLSKIEKATGAILVIAVLLFSTSKYHGIPDVATCLIAIVAFYLFGIMDSKDFSGGISWDLSVFIGIALSLGAVFANTGVSAWMASVIVPALKPIASSPWLFIYVITILIFVWRFIDVAILIPTMAILTPVLPAISEAYGISPLVWVAIYVMAGNCFFMGYQNMWAVMSQSIAGERAWDSKHLLTYGVIYFVSCLIALAAAIPVWGNAGLF